MRKKISLFTLFLSLCLLFTGCGQTELQEAEERIQEKETDLSSRQEEFCAFLNEVNESRRAIYCDGKAPVLDESWTQELADDFCEEEIKNLLTEKTSCSVSPEEAADDVNTFFLLLKNCYGAYDYFGSDEVFLPILDEVLSRLPEEGEVSPSDLERLLTRQLSPILIDGHFTIGDSRLGTAHDKTMYYVDGVYFDDPGDIDPALVKPTIDGEGRLCLGLATLATPTEAVFLPASLEIEGQTLSLQWERDTAAFWDRKDSFIETALDDGTPMLISHAMWGKQSQLDRLAECGSDYADSPVLVLDVRGNGGGSDLYINEWFNGYAGQYPDQRLAFAQKLSAANLLVYQSQLNDEVDIDPCWDSGTNIGTWVEHEGVTLVLQDKGTASSGETAVGNLRTLENTLFLGSNTSGCSLVYNNFHFYLPNSHLDVRFGTGLILRDTEENIDGQGLLPDIWVPSSDATDAAGRMIKYYGLNGDNIE